MSKYPQILNSISLCADGKIRERDLSKVVCLVIHRIGATIGETAEEIAKKFINDSTVSPYTGAEMPYTFIIRKDGTCEQALALSDVGPHARKWSLRGIGIAAVGDFQLHQPTMEQFVAVAKLCGILSTWMGQRPEFVMYGHTQMQYATADLSKKCPGDLFDLNACKRLARTNWEAGKYRDDEWIKSLGVTL